MKKLGILLDSFSGATKKAINDLGFEFVAQVVFIDGKTYNDGENIYAQNIIDTISTIKDFKTSMPAIGSVTKLFKKMSVEYKNVIFITTPKDMSSTFASATMAAKKFKNIYVINTKLISRSIIDVAQRAMKMGNEGKDILVIIKYIQEISDNSFAYVIPKNLERLIKSGRIMRFKKMIMTKAKLIPKFMVTNNGFEIKGISRNFSKICKSIIEKIIEAIGGVEKAQKYNWTIVSTGDENTVQIAKNNLVINGINEIQVSYASVCVIGHIGLGAIGITAWPKK